MSAVLKPEAVVARRWLFASCVLDERSLELLVSGNTVALERKPLEVLLHLLQHAGEVVTKEELIAAVWPGRIISDSALTSTMAKLREALRDEGQHIIKTQHGYGYRLIAPVTIEAVAERAPALFDFNAGQPVPGRPQWALVERLGAGGHGEAWLGRHEKTKEARVFKFALEARHAVSLKREITLYRLLHDALGDAPIVRLLEWNLEELPYFLEMEYVAGGSLIDWAQRQGGLSKVPLATRVGIATRIAEALAQAHSVGVLHKDLKPSNVLVTSAGADGMRIKLCDFGSGGVLDAARLEALGITKLGFTKTIVRADSSAGTPIYFAPEVLAGQPATVQADIYALGVVLYQLAVGDFRKPLAPGWDAEIEDELLREDIAEAAHGSPGRRLPDASILAHRLRTLTQRHEARAAERVAQARAQARQLALDRMRARRGWLAATVAALTLGLGASLWLYRDAARARDSALAVNAFLTQDVIEMGDPTKGDPQENPDTMSLKAMIDRAAGLIDQRLADQPEAAAQLHAAVAHAYMNLNEAERERQHYQRARDLLMAGFGSDDLRTQLVELYIGDGELSRRLELAQQVRKRLEERLGPDHPQVLDHSIAVVEMRLDLGQIGLEQATKEIGALIAGGERALSRGPQAALPRESWALFLDPDADDLDTLIRFKQLVGLAPLLSRAERYEEAAALVASVVPWAEQRYGGKSFMAARARIIGAHQLAWLGRFEDAKAQFERGVAESREWLGPTHKLYLHQKGSFIRLLTSSRRFKDAEAYGREFLREMAGTIGHDNVFAAGIMLQYAHLLTTLGRTAEADSHIRRAWKIFEKHYGPDAPDMIDIKAETAQVRREQGRFAESAALFQELLGQCAGGTRCHIDGTLHALAEVRRLNGELEAAEAIERELIVRLENSGKDPWRLGAVRVGLADTLLRKGDVAGCRDQLDRWRAGTEAKDHYTNEEVRRLRGLLALRDGKHAEARAALEEVLKYHQALTPDGWRVARAREELSRVPKT